MSLETLYYISQTAAVAVIIATLVAVLLQMRQTNRLAKLETSRAVWADAHTTFESMWGSADTGPLMYKYLYTEEPLTEEERIRGACLFGSFLTMFENAHTMSQGALMYEAFWPEMKLVLRRFLVTRRAQQHWHFLRSNFDPNPAFQSEIDAMVADIEASRKKGS